MKKLIALSLACLLFAVTAQGQPTFDTVRSGYYTVTVDGEPTGANYSRRDKADAAAMTAQLANPDAEVRIVPPAGGWAVVVRQPGPPQNGQEFQAYIDGQLARGEQIIRGPTGDLPLDRELTIPAGISEFRGQGGAFVCDTRREFSPLVFRGLDGFLLEGIHVKDVSADTEEGGRAAIFFGDCVNITVRDVHTDGFGASIVFRNCHNIVLDASSFNRAYSWAVYFDNCTNFTVINTTSEDAWLDGIKCGKFSSGGVFIGCKVLRAGRSVVETGDASYNGNGIDFYNGTRDVVLIDFQSIDCQGAGINVKTGPKDWQNEAGEQADWRDGEPGDWHPAGDIRIFNATSIGCRGVGIDLNSNASRAGMPGGLPHQSVPDRVLIYGGTFLRNQFAINAGRCNDGAIIGTITTDQEIRIDPGCVDFHDFSNRIAA